MRTLTWFALTCLTACHQTLPPLDEDTNAETTSDTGPIITTVPVTNGTSTTDLPTSGTSTTTTEEESTSSTTDPTNLTLTTTIAETTVDSTGTTEESTGTTEAPVMAVCGDKVVEGAEECDDGKPSTDPENPNPNPNDDFEQGACRTDCKSAGCGDGIVDFVLGEGCDDANTDDGDGCSATCAVEAAASCGNGVFEPGNGEACDDGNKVDGDGCNKACAFEALGGASCGNGAKAGLEVCDDGNVVNGDACNPTCSLGNKTTLFVGTPGMGMPKDGIGGAAQISGLGAMVIHENVMYLADGSNDSIRKIDLATREVVTIAGAANGTSGYTEGPGAMARFNDVQAIATDGTTLWVGDHFNRRLRAVTLTAPYTVSTVACSGQLGADDSAIGLAATCNDIRGLTYYKGILYMVDAGAGVLRSFDPESTEIKTLAGQKDLAPNQKKSVDGFGVNAKFGGPRHMTADSSGLLYISDSDGYTLRTYHTGTKYLDTLIGTGVAGYVDGDRLTAQLRRPRGLASDGTSIYFSEYDQHTIRQLDLATQTVTTNTGTHCDGMAMCMGGYMEGTGTAALWSAPFEMVYHYEGKALYVLDSVNKVLRKIE